MFGTCQHAMASSQAMKQSSLDLNLSTKKTRKQELLAQMDLVVPWAAHIFKAGRSLLAFGSNSAVKRTRILRAAYLGR